jgi:hypothetical protein
MAWDMYCHAYVRHSDPNPFTSHVMLCPTCMSRDFRRVRVARKGTCPSLICMHAWSWNGHRHKHQLILDVCEHGWRGKAPARHRSVCTVQVATGATM